MKRYFVNGKPTPLISEPPKQKELDGCTIDQLIAIARTKKKSLKNTLINHILGK